MGEAKRRKQLDSNYGKTFWRFILPEDNEIDFAGDAILARVQLFSNGRLWHGWATYADDTIDGFSMTFATVPSNEFDAFLRAKARVRESMGRHLEQILHEAGFSPQPRPNVERSGNSIQDFKMSTYAARWPVNATPGLRST